MESDKGMQHGITVETINEPAFDVFADILLGSGHVFFCLLAWLQKTGGQLQGKIQLLTVMWLMNE